jgi:hypothetical protein
MKKLLVLLAVPVCLSAQVLTQHTIQPQDVNDTLYFAKSVDGSLSTPGIYVSTNNVWFTNLVRTQASLDGSGNSIPLGNDLALHARGAADMILSADLASLTSSTAVSAGVHTITLSASPTATFYVGATLTIDRWTANQETIAVGSWSFGTGDTITATFAQSHSGTYTVDQWGSEDSYGWLWRHIDQNTGTELYRVQAEMSGVNEGFAYLRGNKYLYRVDPNLNQPQFFGDGTNGTAYYGSNGLTGSCANWSWQNNLTDQVVKMYLECSTGDLTIYGGLKLGANTVIPAATTGAHGNGLKIQYSDNTGTSGNLAQFDADGNVVDGPTAPASAIVGLTDTQALTNKTVNGVDPSTLPTKSGTPTVGAGVCWKTASQLGTCTAGTWPNCSTCN